MLGILSLVQTSSRWLTSAKDSLGLRRSAGRTECRAGRRFAYTSKLCRGYGFVDTDRRRRRRADSGSQSRQKAVIARYSHLRG